MSAFQCVMDTYELKPTFMRDTLPPHAKVLGYKQLYNLNFARYTEQYGSYMPSSPLWSVIP